MKRELSKIGELATYVNGYAFKPSDWSLKGRPIIRIQDLTGNDYQTNYYESTLDEKYKIKKGDLLISWSASIGIYEWDKEDAWLNQHIFKVVFDKGVDIEKKYFQFAVGNALKKVSGLIHGSTMKHLTKSAFDSIQVPLYSVDEQLKIVQRLEAMQRSVNISKKEIEKLDTLVKSRFIEMFGDLHHNPLNWPIRNFTDCATIESNMIHDFTGYEDFPHIGIDSIEKNTGALTGYRTVREDGIISGKYRFTPKHIIYSKIRPNLNKVALPDFEGVCSADSYAILPKEFICNRIFLAYVMRSSVFLDYILPFSNRTNLPKVNRKQVEGFTLPTPPIDLQNQFAAFVEQVEKSKTVLHKLLEKQKLLRAALMQEYFGE